MRLWELEDKLSHLESWSNPKVSLEQYATTPHLAAHILNSIEETYGDFDGGLVADLGCGFGILSTGAALLGAEAVVGIDIDMDSLKLARQNAIDLGVDEAIEFMQSDVRALGNVFGKGRVFDCVMMNPPFGTKQNKGIDIEFLKVASEIASSSVYSLHKTTTRRHVRIKAQQYGLTGEVVAQLKYDLGNTFKFHKKRSQDIEVDFWRFAPEE